MSFPYPQDRNRERREKGEEPYKEARQAMAETEADLQAEAEAYGEEKFAQRDEERRAALAADAAEAMRRVGAERAHADEHD